MGPQKVGTVPPNTATSEKIVMAAKWHDSCTRFLNVCISVGTCESVEGTLSGVEFKEKFPTKG